MKMIVTADRSWAIGKNGQLLVRIPSDMKRLREETAGKIVVMGRKTYETMGNSLMLMPRMLYVLTESPGIRKNGVKPADSLESLRGDLKNYDTEDIYCIGGEKTFRELLPYCDTVYVTKINFVYEANQYFPDLDTNEDWEMTDVSEEQTYFDLEYEFRCYRRKKDV